MLKIPQLTSPGYEADDVIATVTATATADDWRVLVVTGDRDSFQLVSDDVTVLYTRRGISDVVTASPEWIAGKYGVTPAQYRDYAALRGDTSDNLPGVPGVGEKTAARLIAEYGSLEGIYEHIDEQTPKLRENLEEHREQVFLNRDLMEMLPDVPIVEEPDGVVPEMLRLQEWDRDEVQRVFAGLAFRDVWERLTELGGFHADQAEARDIGVATVNTVDQINAMLSDLGGQVIAIEPVWEADGVQGVVVAVGPERAVFVPEALLADLITTIAPDRGIAVHDAKPLLRALNDAGLELPGLAFDTALAGYIINPGQRVPDLEDLAYRELGIAVAPAGDDSEEAQASFDFEGSHGPDLDALGRRAIAVRELVDPLQSQLDARGESDLFVAIELPLVGILARMESTGVLVDRNFLEGFGNDLRKRLGDLETSIHEAAGGSFNINSTLQLAGDTVRSAGPARAQEDTKGGAVDRCVGARQAA